MNEKPQIKLSETVVLIDAAFLNFIITDMKKYFEGQLARPLPDLDLSVMATCMTLDAGITEGKNEIQLFFVYDEDFPQLLNCRPSDLKTELNGVAFKNQFGEYLFASVPTEGMVSREELFMDLLTIISDSADVKKVIAVSYDLEYGDAVTKVLNGMQGKEVLQFRMMEPELPVEYRWDMLLFPLMQAFGIKADELQ